MGSQIYTRLPPREGVWPVGGRASGYTPSLVPPRGGATSCLPPDSSTYYYLLVQGQKLTASAEWMALPSCGAAASCRSASSSASVSLHWRCCSLRARCCVAVV